MSRSSDPTKPAEWRGRFTRFVSCGLAVAPFCAQEGVSVASFYLWRKKLGAKGRPPLDPLLGRKGWRRRRRPSMTGGPRRDGTGSTDGYGIFQQVAVVPTRPTAIGAAPAVVPASREFIPAASVMISAQAVSIQLPCGTRIEVDAADLDAVRAIVAEVLRANRGCEAGMARC